MDGSSSRDRSNVRRRRPPVLNRCACPVIASLGSMAYGGRSKTAISSRALLITWRNSWRTEPSPDTISISSVGSTS
jgi:hypothetical protein